MNVIKPVAPVTPVLETPIRDVRGGRARAGWTALALVVLLLLTVVASLAWGSRHIPFADVIEGLLGRGDRGVIGIVGELRVNRTVLGIVCGAALGMSGALMQGLTRNPVADPGILGINAGASFGVVGLLTLTGTMSLGASVWSAVVGAGLATAVVLLLASGPDVASARLVLCGVALAAVLTGLTHALVLLDEQVGESYRAWQVGSLTTRPVNEVLTVLPVLLCGAVLALLLPRSLDALALGDDMAHGLGVRPVRTRALGLVAVALLAGTATGLAGPISFVGLVVPHLLRPIVGHEFRRLLPLSALGGAILLLSADVAGRLMGDGAELQVGVVTALVGAPVLALFVLGRRAGVSR